MSYPFAELDEALNKDERDEADLMSGVGSLQDHSDPPLL